MPVSVARPPPTGINARALRRVAVVFTDKSSRGNGRHVVLHACGTGRLGCHLWGWIGKEVTRQWDQLDPGADPLQRSHRLALERQQVLRRQTPLMCRLGLLAIVIAIAPVTVGLTTR